MKGEEIETVVLSVLRAVLKFEVNNQASMESVPQWDSLKHIEIIFALEDALDLQFSEDILPDLNSVGVIIDEIARHFAS